MDNKSHQAHLTDAEALALLKELFDDGDIGFYPERVDNGADCYTCPCCGASTKVMGHAFGTEPLHSHPHEPNCKLMRLYQAMKERP